MPLYQIGILFAIGVMCASWTAYIFYEVYQGRGRAKEGE